MSASSGVLPACPSCYTWAAALRVHCSGQTQNLSMGLVIFSLLDAHTYTENVTFACVGIYIAIKLFIYSFREGFLLLLSFSC